MSNPQRIYCARYLAHTLARAVYDMLRRDTACDMHKFLNGERSGVSEPTASLDLSGICLRMMLWKALTLRR